MKVTLTYTHKGWFGICPVYIGDADGDAPLVDPRHWIFAPLMWFSERMYDVCFFVASTLNPEFEAAWPISMEEMDAPVVRVEEMDDE